MARRERTTALPRARARAADSHSRRTGVASWLERRQRLAIVGGALALLVVILGVFAYQVYEDRVGTPNKVVLTVGSEKFKLNYYADRLGQFIQANAQSGSTPAVLEEDLINKLEREALVIQVARDQGIALGDNEVTEFIASQLGVTVGGSGSTFDTLYRNALRTQKVSDGNYRRLKLAELADARVAESVTATIGASGEQYAIQTVVLTSKEAADAILARAKAGEDLGDLAQKESLDPASKQKNGLNSPEPIELLPATIRTAVEGKQPGELLGPVQVEQAWWVFRIDRKEPVDYSDTQKSQLASQRLEDLVKQKRSQLASTIRRALSASDIKWAEQHLN